MKYLITLELLVHSGKNSEEFACCPVSPDNVVVPVMDCDHLADRIKNLLPLSPRLDLAVPQTFLFRYIGHRYKDPGEFRQFMESEKKVIEKIARDINLLKK